MTNKLLLITGSWWLFLCVPAIAQTNKPNQPKTKIEAFDGKTGAVIVRGFTTIGVVRGEMNLGDVRVEAVEIIEATSGSKVFGVKIDVEKDDRGGTENASFVDFDEIDSLLKGIDYISKLDTSATQMKTFQADYRTKDGLAVSTFSKTNGSVGTAVTAGETATVFLSREDLIEFRSFIAQAKSQIDAEH